MNRSKPGHVSRRRWGDGIETSELLKVVLARLEEMSAELKGLQVEVRTGLGEVRTGLDEVRSELKEFRRDANERLEKIEERMDYMALKWTEHDEEIYKIKRRRS